ncbi:MAG: ABC transporter ATP-binding protein/permease [Oscillospiraceae bacterium]|nr:ABC transporter ATP-binding protein/permease [Oscillospiraceae bacterium]
MKIFKNLKFLLSRAWETSKSYFLIMVVATVFRSVLPLINIIGLGTVINALVTGEPYNQVTKIIIIYLSVNLGITVIKEILQFIETYKMRVNTNAAQFVWCKDIVDLNYHYAQDGTIMNLRKKSMLASPAFYLGNIVAFLNYFMQFAGIISIFSILSPLFILMIAATSTVSIILVFKTQKNDFDFQNEKVEDDRKIDYLYKVMTGYNFAKEVRINNAENYIADKYAGILRTQINKLKALYRKSIKINLVSTVITIAQTAIMYFYFSYQVYADDITVAEYTVLLSATTLLTSILLGFFGDVARLGRVFKAIDFYREYKNLMDTQSGITASNNLNEKHIDFSNAIIKFENVSFTYPKTDKVILKNINAEIKKGEKIGIVGLNGSGKTTFIKLLTRIYDPTDGRITINGVDIKNIPHNQYIKHIGIVLQDFMLFAYSVKENVLLDTDYDETKFTASINKSGLKEKIAGLKNGIDTSVYKTLDENGVEFSGGEGQKLALARAIYKDAETLILDEPTSALDPIAEYELFSKLNDISENKATIFISHRLSSTKFCDKIIVFSDGNIIECGSHEELIKQNAFYADLFNAQARYYREKGVSVNE